MSEIKKYAYIDSLRGLAILLVIVVHAALHFQALSPDIFFLTFKGQYGVQLFFITSALTLFLSFKQRANVDKANTVRFFLIRRFFRIAPAFYLAILFYSMQMLLKPVSTIPNPVNLLNVVLSVFFVNGFFPTSINYVPPGGWSVAIEMIFYLLIPFLFSQIRSLKTAVVYFFVTLLFGIACNHVGAYLMTHYTNLDYSYHKTWYFYFWLPNQLPIFMLGIILFHLLKRDIRISKNSAVMIVVGSCAGLLGVFYSIKYFRLEDVVPEHVLVGILFSCIVFAMSQARIRLLENRVTSYLGKLSFSMYLWHFFVLECMAFIIRRVMPVAPFIQLAALYITAIPLICIVSSISYHKVELAGMKLGKKVIDKLQGKPVYALPADGSTDPSKKGLSANTSS